MAVIFPVAGQGGDLQGTDREIIMVHGQVRNGGISFTWNPQDFAGFYYDLDCDVGTEELTATLSDGKLSGSYPYGLVYQTVAQEMPFRFRDWGSYSVIGFLGELYFAGYLESRDPDENFIFGKSTDKSALAKGLLLKVLVDDDTENTITTKTPLKLEEGYELIIKSIDVEGNDVYLELYKDGNLVDNKIIHPSIDDATMTDKTYYYRNPQVGDLKGLVTIAVHYKNAFRGADQNLATVNGIFQISDSPISIAEGTSFGKMTVSSVGSDRISMDNRDSPITLSKNKDVLLAGDLHLRTADQDIIDAASPIRFYPYRRIDSPGEYDIRGSAATGESIWLSQSFAGFYYDLDHDAGTEMLLAVPRGKELSGDYPYGLAYDTIAQEIPFQFQDWGSYSVIGFLGEMCFAGYKEGSDPEKSYLFEKSTNKSVLAKGQLQKVLIDDDTEKTITSNNPLKLKEGYELVLKSISPDGNDIYVVLSKNGTLVSDKILHPSKEGATAADKTYYYRNSKVGGLKGLVTVAVHFKNAFRGADQNIATVDGVWQISENPINVRAGVQHGKMTITTVDSDGITMDNRDSPITLSRNKDISLMGDIRLRTADSDLLRYYIYKHAKIKESGAEEEAAAQKAAPSKEDKASSLPSDARQSPTEEDNGASHAGSRQGGAGGVAVPLQGSLVRTIGPEGGSIDLGDGIRIVFPAGSVDNDMEVSGRKIDSSAYLKDDLYDGVVIAVDNQQRKLNLPAEIRVPLPSYVGLEDASLVSGGTIDESTGTLIVEDCRIEASGEGVEAVLSADHFSNRFVRYFKENFLSEPVECKPLTVPYYEQGGPWCWAACTLMVCQAANIEPTAQVFQVIGKVGAFDRTGMPPDRVSSLNGYVIKHTSIEPETQVLTLTTQMADHLRTYVRKQLAFKHNPVVVFSSNRGHAWVIVGYDGDRFYVHDPADPKAIPPYTLMEWGSESEGLCKLWTVDALSTLVVPKDISSSSYPASLNLLGEGELSFNARNPKTNRPIKHAFQWTNSESGYCISGPSGVDKDGLPADVTELKVGGISIANPDRKSARLVTVSINVMEADKDSSTDGVSKSNMITVPPASVVNLAFDPIKISDFYIDGKDKYKFRAQAFEENKLVAEAVFLFQFEPSSEWKIWTKVTGTDTKLYGIGGFTDFTYALRKSGSTMTFTGSGLFPGMDIVGTISGDTFTGTFIDHDPKSSNYGKTYGLVEITFSSDGNHFTGRLRMDDKSGSEIEWGGDKVS